MKHSILAPSAAHRWMKCPGSVHMVRLSPQEERSEAADVGTAAHFLAELCYYEKREPWEYVGCGIMVRLDGECNVYLAGESSLVYPHPLLQVDRDMATSVGTYLDYVNDIKTRGGTVFTEYGYDRASLLPYARGRVDCLIAGPGAKMEIIDYKHGKSPVEVEGNVQLLNYAVNALYVFCGAEEIKLTIVQPRAFHADGTIRSWVLTRKDLETWQNQDLLPAMHAALQPSAKLVPGKEQCQYCPAQTQCPALQEKLLEVTDKLSSNWTDESVGEMLGIAEEVASLVPSLKKKAMTKLKAGVSVQGYKLTRKRGRRVWAKEADAAGEAAKLWGDEAFDAASLKTPAQMEALPGGADFVSRHGYKEDGSGMTLVREDGKQSSKYDEMFREGLPPGA